MISRRRKFQKGEQGNAPSFIVGVVLLGIVGYLAFSDWKIYQARTTLQRQLQRVQEEMQRLQQRNAELERLLAKTETEEYREEIARERLNLKKSGEEVVAIIAPINQQEQDQPPKQNLLQKVLTIIPFLRD